MFRNVGKKVKVVTIILFVLSLLFTLAIAATVYFAGDSLTALLKASGIPNLPELPKSANLIAAIIVLVFGFLASLLTAWFRFALGVAAQEAETAAVVSEGTAEKVDQIHSALLRRARPQQNYPPQPRQGGYPPQQAAPQQPRQNAYSAAQPQQSTYAAPYANNSAGYATDPDARTRRTRVHTEAEEENPQA